MQKDSWKKAFNQGYACALATIVKSHGEDTAVTEALACNMMDPSEIDEEDRPIIVKIQKEIRRLDRALRAKARKGKKP